MTVAEVIAELQKMPPHLPMAGTVTIIEYASEDLDDQGSEYVERREVGEVSFQGRCVVLICDGPLQP